MADFSQKKRGPKKKGEVKVWIKLLPGHLNWLDDLVSQLKHGTSKESIIQKWIIEKFATLCDEGVLRRPPGSVPAAEIVPLEKEKENPHSDTENQMNRQQES